MAGEEYVLEIEADYYGTAQFLPNMIVQIDTNTSHTTPQNLAAQIPAATAGLSVLGVCKDEAHLDAVTGLVTSTGMNIRIMGISRVIADAAFAAGAYVQTSGTTAGHAVGLAPGTTGTKVPALGIALTPAQASGDQPLVLLTPGVLV